ncbi:DUF6381 family protein [Streptomyces sp. NBC_01361]|uniref:DUF6381 family protein n=1 Tax=Streptomyces sp. NBC_01361 TaxID=2903838 RepID=UPI003FCD2C1F
MLMRRARHPQGAGASERCSADTDCCAGAPGGATMGGSNDAADRIQVMRRKAHDLDQAADRATDTEQWARLKAKAQRLRDQIDQAGMQATNSVACIHSRLVCGPTLFREGAGPAARRSPTCTVARWSRAAGAEPAWTSLRVCDPLDGAVRPMTFPRPRSDGRISAVRRRDRSRVRPPRWRPGHVRRSPCPSTRRTSPCPS